MSARLVDGSSPGKLAEEIGERLGRDEGWSKVRVTIAPSGFEGARAAPFDLPDDTPPDRTIYLSDRPSPFAAHDAESGRWFQVALGEGTNLAWTRVGVDSAPAVSRRIFLEAIRTGPETTPPFSIEVRFETPESELLAHRPLVFGPDDRAQIVIEESEISAGRVDRVIVRLLREGGAPLDDALPSDDHLLLARNPTLSIALPGEEISTVRRALDRWSELGVAEWDGSLPGPDLIFLDGPEPADRDAARAILLPGAICRGVRYGEPEPGGWIDRVADHPLTREVAWDRLRPERVHPPTALPAGSTPLAWIGDVAVAWETARGDLVLAFDLEPQTFGQPEPPEAIPELLLALLTREQPAPGRLAAYRPEDRVSPALRRRGVGGPVFGGITTRIVEGDGVAAAIVAIDPDEARVARQANRIELPTAPAPAGRSDREIAPWLIATALVLTLAYTARKARRTA